MTDRRRIASVILPCARCGTDAEFSKQFVEWSAKDGNPLHCDRCHNLAVDEHRAARKAELDALPRCAVCKRRGTNLVGVDQGARLCGQHLKIANRRLAASVPGHLAGLALFAGVGNNLTGADVVALLAPSDKQEAML